MRLSGFRQFLLKMRPTRTDYNLQLRLQRTNTVFAPNMQKDSSDECGMRPNTSSMIDGAENSRRRVTLSQIKIMRYSITLGELLRTGTRRHWFWG